ncbi:MAG: hypothetical protein GXN93_03310 [Candidatus Diapherotrites archaeon]|nr:hypothetical protein [Candidatus Diapherotrites archaeon]
MPTYRNVGNTHLVVDGVSFAPGEEKAVKKVLRHPLLVKVSDEPFIPFVLSRTVTGTAGAVVEVEIDDERNVIELRELTAQVLVYINSPDAPDALPLSPGAVVRITHESEIERLFVRFVTSGNLRILQIKEGV